MAADYNKPVTTDNYADILTQLRDNIAAAQNMLNDLTGVTNIPTDALRYDQTAKKFQIYNGTTFVDTVLSKESGGTGTTTALGSAAFIDYESGSYTPVISFGTAAGSTTYGFQSGEFVRVGSMVSFSMLVTFTNTGGSGLFEVTNGLPYPVDLVSPPIFSIRTKYVDFTGQLLSYGSGSKIFLQDYTSAALVKVIDFSDLRFGGGADYISVNVTGSYRADIS